MLMLVHDHHINGSMHASLWRTQAADLNALHPLDGTERNGMEGWMQTQTHLGFGCIQVHRERNRVEDPFWHICLMSYRRMNSSSRVKWQKTPKKKSISWSISPGLTRSVCVHSLFSAKLRISACFSLLRGVVRSSSPKAHGKLWTCRHVDANSNIIDAPPPAATNALQQLAVPPLLSGDTSPGPGAATRSHARARDKLWAERWKWNSSQRWVSEWVVHRPRARLCLLLLFLLLSTPVPREELTHEWDKRCN